MTLRQRKRSDAGSVKSAASDQSKLSQETLSEGSSSHHDEDESGNEGDVIEEVMRDNLELMLEIVMRLREDPHFASTIYADCPRLQHLLDQHPDLRPIFEDPYLVRINFEKVYKDAGGVLPEDQGTSKGILATIVNHPLFKVFRFLLVLKKIANCIMGGGAAFAKSLFSGILFDDAADLADQNMDQDQNAGREIDDDQHDTSPENQENKDSLNRAADHMEDPEVQERMNEILQIEDPEELDEAIENDPELKALRDSNPLCEELMSDPETLRILVDPDNLRALGECPDLIDQDFSSPDWSPPDVEAGPELDGAGDTPGLDTIGETDFEGGDTFDAEPEFDEDLEGELDMEAGDEEIEGGDDAEGDDEGGDEEEEEEEGLEFEMGDEEAEQRDKPSKSKSKSKAKNQTKKRGEQQRGNFFHNMGVGLTDMIAGEVVGDTAEFIGADEGLGALEDAGDDADRMADQAADAAEVAADQAADNMDAMAETAEVLMDDEVAGNLEDGMDQVEETHEERAEDREKRKSAVAAGAAGGAGAVAGGKNRDVEEGDEEEEEEDKEEEEEEEEEEKKGRFAFVGNFLGAVSTAAKEMVATELLGDDFGEQLVEEMEEEEEEDDEEEEEGDKKKKKKGGDGKDDEEGGEGEGETSEEKEEEQEPKQKRRGLFRRKKDAA